MSCRLWILYYVTHSICIVDFTCVIISFGCLLRFTMSEVNTLDTTQRSNLWVLRINYTLGTLKRLITNVFGQLFEAISWPKCTCQIGQK